MGQAVAKRGWRSEDAVHAEESEDGDCSDGQERKETENELFLAGLGDEVEVDALNRPTAVRNWLVGLHVDPPFRVCCNYNKSTEFVNSQKNGLK